MLDYGCGRGPVSAVAPEFGLIPTGIEPDPLARSAAAEQLKMTVYANLDGVRSDVASPQFDVILLWQVIEHLRLPWQDLQALRGLLSPRGKLLMGTMNVNCLRARIERSRWTHYLNPTHFYYLDRKSLERILTGSGFSGVTEWKPKFRYPQHGVTRRYLYEAANVFGVADGLYYLCSGGLAQATEANMKLKTHILANRKGCGTPTFHSNLWENPVRCYAPVRA